MGRGGGHTRSLHMQIDMFRGVVKSWRNTHQIDPGETVCVYGEVSERACASIIFRHTHLHKHMQARARTHTHTHTHTQTHAARTVLSSPPYHWHMFSLRKVEQRSNIHSLSLSLSLSLSGGLDTLRAWITSKFPNRYYMGNCLRAHVKLDDPVNLHFKDQCKTAIMEFSINVANWDMVAQDRGVDSCCSRGSKELWRE